MTNTNCLEGWKCPNCGNEDRFEVEAITWVNLTDDGSEPIGDTEFSQDSLAKCPECETAGTVATFTDTTATTAPMKEK